MATRVLVFFLVVILIVGGASVYVHRAAARLARLGPRGRRALGAVLAGGLVLSVASRVVERRVPASVLAPLGVIGAVITVGVLLAAVLLAAVDLAGLALRLARAASRLARVPPPAAAPVAPPALPPPPAADASRRSFLAQAATGSALALGAGSSAYGALFGRHDYVIEEVPFALPGLSRRLDGYTLVQLSDIHLGLFVGEPEMRAAEALVQKARPDLLVLTGDLIDHDASHVAALGRLVRRLAPLARDGVVVVPGNHDYYAGLDEILAALDRAGAQVLRNGGRLVGDAGARFALLGVDDPAGERYTPRSPGPDVAAALAALPAAADLPRVLLCHNPAYFVAAAGRVDLQLSGHTHGGQIRLGVSPASLVLGHPFIAGRYERAGSRLYVNRGFGTAGPPARVGAAPEVTRVVLTSG
jgi:predicted MPP superfamily phosphohydrolase